MTSSIADLPSGRRRRGAAWFVLLLLLAFVVSPMPVTAMPTNKTVCARVGRTRVVNGIRWRCDRQGRVLRWTRISSATTSTTVKNADPVKLSPLERSKTDRPGVGQWDVKFIYATFKGGPDSRRDISGDIQGIANDVNRYFESQFPGHRVRYDTYQGRLDVQYVELPVTNKEFRSLFVDDCCILEDFFQQTLQGMGLKWTHGMDRNVYGHNDRLYVMLAEGFRGPKFGPDGPYEYECTDWDNNWTGISVRFLRKLDGTPCPGQVGYWLPTPEQWKASYSETRREFIGPWPIPELSGAFKPWGFTIIRGLLFMMMAYCEKGAREIIKLPTPERPYVLRSNSDIWSSGSQFDRPLGHPDIAKLDPTHDYYFKITNGPRARDTCYDLQYSKYWEKIGG